MDPFDRLAFENQAKEDKYYLDLMGKIMGNPPPRRLSPKSRMEKKQELQRIVKENQEILERLQGSTR